MIIGDYEVTQTKNALLIIKDGKRVCIKPKRKEYTDKELKKFFEWYKRTMML